MRTRISLAAAAGLAVASGVAAQVQLFSFPMPHPAALFSKLSLSVDGSVLVGTYSANSPYSGGGFTWTPTQGLREAGALSPGFPNVTLHSVSGNGQVAVGQGYTSVRLAIREVVGSQQPEVIASELTYDSRACAANWDGSVIFGAFSQYFRLGDVHLFRWRAGAPQWEDLGVLGNAESINDVPIMSASRDGSVVVGDVYLPFPGGILLETGFRWTEVAGLTLLFPEPGQRHYNPVHVSPDGSASLGLTIEVPQTMNRQIGLNPPFPLYTLPTGFGVSDISGDGAVAVGSVGSSYPYHATFWTPTGGLQDLVSFLIAAGIDTSPWPNWLWLAAVSENGRVMAGVVQRTGNISECVVITLPAPPIPCYANCDNSTGQPLLTANDFQCFLNQFAAGNSTANCDGSTTPPILNANDFQCFLNQFGQGCP